MKPLAPDSIPEPTDLTHFWKNAEAVLEGVHPTIDPYVLGAPELEKLGPVILGQVGWTAVINANGGITPHRW